MLRSTSLFSSSNTVSFLSCGRVKSRWRDQFYLIGLFPPFVSFRFKPFGPNQMYLMFYMCVGNLRLCFSVLFCFLIVQMWGIYRVQLCATCDVTTCASDACAVFVMSERKTMCLSLFVFRSVMHLVVQTWCTCRVVLSCYNFLQLVLLMQVQCLCWINTNICLCPCLYSGLCYFGQSALGCSLLRRDASVSAGRSG